MARLGGLVSLLALVAYLTWRIGYTLPAGGAGQTVAWALVGFEALPLLGLGLKVATLWSIDGVAPAPVTEPPNDLRVVVLIPTYNEPAEVVAPTIAAACQLQPDHETWVLDDGDRPWLAQMCQVYGARYVCRPLHDHAKAGNMNHALDLMATEEAAGGLPLDIIAVLDCDHVPLPTFLTATLGWFVDEDLALVQAPQAYYNVGAFDDDGVSGEQGLFFNVLLPARNHEGAGPFWCGSTSLLRIKALREVGGVATESLVEDMHTTLKLIKRGWKTVYHHQTVALGLAPATPEQYLLQRRRWGMGAMQVLVQERLWAAKKWMSWRNYHEYLTGTIWWLEGVATIAAFAVPIGVMLTGATTTTASPLTFTVVFTAMFTARLWGTKRLMRKEIQWPTAFALRVLRVPIAVSCVWWLVSRQSLRFEVTPKGASNARVRGRIPRIVGGMNAIVGVTIVYAALGLAGVVPWRTAPASTVAAGAWLLLAAGVLMAGTARIQAARYATSRRNSYRVPLSAPVTIDGAVGELVDISVGGAAVRFPMGSLPNIGMVEISLPGAAAMKMIMARLPEHTGGFDVASLQVVPGDWSAHRALSLWMFHTPAGAVPGLRAGVPAVALYHLEPAETWTARVRRPLGIKPVGNDLPIKSLGPASTSSR